MRVLQCECSCYTMHIPDGFLSPPVWAALDVAALPCVGYMARKAQQGFDEARVPLLGVMGAFVFAAQIINFPVGIGTSGHLVGAALLAITLGPASASLVMTAILVVQSLVFQDGGVLALGANIMNMGVMGVLCGYLPFHILAGKHRKTAVFLGGFLSLLVAALLALSELLLSGVAMPVMVLGLSLGLFLISAVLEGVITLAIFQSLEAINPRFIRQPSAERSKALGALALAAVLLTVVGVLIASAHPDGLEKLAENLGIAGHAKALVQTPLADYQLNLGQSQWLQKAAAGMVGLLLISSLCLLLGRILQARAANRSAARAESTPVTRLSSESQGPQSPQPMLPEYIETPDCSPLLAHQEASSSHKPLAIRSTSIPPPARH
jgi:cobalt/nickel transport system permease protein